MAGRAQDRAAYQNGRLSELAPDDHWYQEFLNDFYISYIFHDENHDFRRAMFAEEPVDCIGEYGKIDHKENAFMAGFTEYKHRRWGMGPPPAWINQPKRYLAEPDYGWHVPDKPEEFQRRIDHQIPEFSKRNIWTSNRPVNSPLDEPFFNPRWYNAGDLESRHRQQDIRLNPLDLDRAAWDIADKAGDEATIERLFNEMGDRLVARQALIAERRATRPRVPALKYG